MPPGKPTIRIVPEGGVSSDWEQACGLGEDYGLPTDPFQKELIRDILTVGSNGRYVAPTFGFSSPRRVGKSHIITVLTLYLMLIKDQRIIYTAHHSQSSGEMWRKILDKFENTELAAHVESISRREGREEILLREGGSFRIFSRATGKGSGRGSEADVLILDEALMIGKGTLSDLLPVTLNSENPLTIYLGTPSIENSADGIAFRRFRAAVIDGLNPSAGWVEFSASASSDITDTEVWAQAVPAMMTGRVAEETLRAALHSGISRKEFLVEYLGCWDAETRPTIVDMGQWHDLADLSATIAPDSEVILGVDAANDRSRACIVAVGLNSRGVRVVEVLEHRSGVTWLPEILKKITDAQDHLKSVVIDKRGALSYMAEALDKDNVPVVLTETEYMANACGAFVDSVEARTFKHRGDTVLTHAVSGAALRKLMSRFAFQPAEQGNDITALVASALALYGLDSDKTTVSKKKKNRSGGVWIGGKYYNKNS